jgi:hypothetical protein
MASFAGARTMLDSEELGAWAVDLVTDDFIGDEKAASRRRE